MSDRAPHISGIGRTLPGSAQRTSPRAQGLRLREVLPMQANTPWEMLPSRQRTRSAPRNSTRFAAQYSARGLPCERFTAVLTDRTSCITRGRGGWLDLPRGGLAPPIPCQLSWRALHRVMGCPHECVSPATGVPQIAADLLHGPSRQGRPSRPGEFHPEPLTDPDLNLSIHPARVTARRLPPSAEPSGSSRFDPVGPRSTTMTHPLPPTPLAPLRPYYQPVRPSPPHPSFQPHG